jgi:hypothetical protein
MEIEQPNLHTRRIASSRHNLNMQDYPSLAYQRQRTDLCKEHSDKVSKDYLLLALLRLTHEFAQK